MFCERCKKVEATIHLTEIIKDVKSEVHLCENCARDIGLNSKLSNFSLTIPEMLSFLDVNEVGEGTDGITCKKCGQTFMDYKRDGKLGCPDCYLYIGDSLKSIIAGYHGENRHIGKHPNNFEFLPDAVIEQPVQLKEKNSINELREQLNIAVSEERYEDAALLRDKIKELD